jgi:hypothetical protein
MADDPTKQAQDRTRINMSEDYEVAYWTRELGVSKERLERLVREHGDRADDVRRALGATASAKN